MKLLQVIVVGSILAVCLTVTLTSAAAQEPKPDAGSLEARTSTRLPSLFDFAKFKAMFHKRYRSLAEELVRQKIFLARAFRAFISMIKYRYYQATSYLSLNKRSDLTAEERERTKMPLDKAYVPEDANIPFVHVPTSISSSEEDEADDESEVEQPGAVEEIPVAELGEIERQLEEIERNKEQPGYRELAQELEKARGEILARQKRNVGEKSRRESLTLDDLMRGGQGQMSQEAREKVQRRVPSNNPDFERPELQSSAGEIEEEGWVKPLSDGVASVLMQLPGASLLSQAVSSFVANRRDQPNGTNKKKKWKKPDKVFVDFRTANCMFAARDQGDCGSCYIFAPIALYEYLFCAETGNLVAFSEQYSLDCGPRLDPDAFDGCDGGKVDISMSFIEHRGLELRLDYPYKEMNDTCPYEPDVEPHKMGLVRTSDPGFGQIKLEQFEDYMGFYNRPIITNVNVCKTFEDYGGGVDTSEDCGETAHSMLIVGHGREDGIDYFLFRNSHSTSWGDQGYYKQAKSALSACITQPLGWVAMSHFKYHDRLLNPHQADKAYLFESAKTQRGWREY